MTRSTAMRYLLLPFAVAALGAAPAIGAGAPSLLSDQPAIKAAEPPAPAAAVKLGHVDLQKILAESDYGTSIQAKMKERQAKLQTQIDAKRKQLEKQKAAIEGKLSTYTQQQKESKAREFQKKVDEFQKLGLESEKELAKLQDEQQRLFLEAVEKACGTFGKTGGFAMIIVKKELLYLGDGVDAQDVTGDIIKLLTAPAAAKK